MRHILLASFILTFAFASFSQSHSFGTISLSATYDGGAQFATFNQKYNGNQVGQEDTTGAITSLFRFDGHFNILRFLSVGFNYRGGKYIEDPENTQARGNKLGVYALGVRFYPVNKDKIVWYAGPTLGVTKLEMNKVTEVFDIPYQYKFSAVHFGFETGINWYFAGRFGMNFGLGYSSQNLLMTNFTFDGTEQNLSGWENILASKGAHVNIGVTYHLGGN